LVLNLIDKSLAHQLTDLSTDRSTNPPTHSQIHDEVILEGPEEHVEEALNEVRSCMEHPWSDDGVGLGELRVTLDVDAKYEKTWYKAK
jgi:DNA polymerase I-like protein with 3'-5' exonuclease and polymerase domains